jgi:hypothetical protein
MPIAQLPGARLRITIRLANEGCLRMGMYARRH